MKPTEEQIENAGRYLLDAYVLRHIIKENPVITPDYSESAKYAWTVIEKFSNKTLVDIHNVYTRDKWEWRVCIGLNKIACAEDVSFPVAACKAALYYVLEIECDD